MHAFIVRDKVLPAPDGLQVHNFKSTGEARFVNQKRTTVPTEVVVHETVTSSARATVAVLQQRRLGVHLIVGSDGTIYQHGDLATDLLWHASEHNGASVGIETVNPYYPKFNPTNSPWTTIIKAPWADKGMYVVPTSAQAEAVAQLLMWLTTPTSGLAIPAKFVGVTNRRIALGRTPQSQCGPGIYAHHYFGHADGAWLVLYAWLRMRPKLEPWAAYEEACRLTMGAGTSVDLAAHDDTNSYPMA